MPCSQVKLKARMEKRLQTLERRLAEIDQTLREPEGNDPEEQAVDLDDDDVLESLAVAGRNEMYLIRTALGRMEQGHYGRCQSCGRRISDRRLRALPEASTCLRCARSGAGELN